MNRHFIAKHFEAITFAAFLAVFPVVNTMPVAAAEGYNFEIDPAQVEIGRWDLLQINALEAWELTDGGQGVVVAVLDNGIDKTHPALKGKVIDSVNLTGDAGIDAERGHGTHIGGIIAAAFDQNGNSGLAYNSGLLDVKVAGNEGRTDAQKVAEGIIWAADHGAQVINISIVIENEYPQLEAAVGYAWEKGCVIIAAAGNNGLTAPVFPASYPNVIAVAATDENDALTRWSARGEWVDVAAPGVDINSTLPGDHFGNRSGTSFSTALVSGESALLFSVVKDLNEDGKINDEVIDLIIANCDTEDGSLNAVGRINVGRAVLAATVD